MTTTPEAIAVEARRQSAQVRQAAGRLAASVENLEQRAAIMTSAERRRILARAADVIIDAARVRAAAEKTIPASAPAIYLVSIRQETTSIMNAAALAIRKVSGATAAYAGLFDRPVALALAITEDLAEMGAKPTKANTALRGAARAQFDKSKAAIKPKVWTVKAQLLKTKSADGAPMISGVASSTAIDLGNERFSRACLKQMAEAFPGKNLWLDHSYKIAEDLAGRMVSAVIKKNGEEYDLHITAELNQHNERAMRVYAALKDGYSAGLSVGVIVLEQRRLAEQNDRGVVTEITSCNPLELSLCGIPALPRANTTGAKRLTGAALREAREMYAIKS